MNPSPHQIIGVMLLALCVVGLIWTIDHYRAWFRDQLLYAWDYTREYVRPERPEQRTLEEYNNQYAHEADIADDGLTIAEAVASVPELDLDGTQPFQAFHEDSPDGPVIATARVGGVFLPLSEDVLGPGAGTGGAAHPPRPEYATDVPRPGPAATGVSRAPVPGYLPFQPHAGPPAWSPRHAKTSWVDELITDCLGAPSVEVYMWNWQQRHRLAVTA